MLKAVKEVLKSTYGTLVEGLDDRDQMFVFRNALEVKVQRNKRGQIKILRLDLSHEEPVATVIPTSETRWSRMLCADTKEVSDFIVVDFAKDLLGKMNNLMALTHGVKINNIIASSPEEEQYWLDLTEGKTFKMFLQSPSQARTASAVFMADKDWKGGYAHQWEDCVRQINYGYFPKKPMAVAKFLSSTGLAQSSTQVCNAQATFKTIPDYVADNGIGEFKYSDGMGNISYKMLEEIASTLGLGYIPSAVQVRIGGIKGLLLRDDDLTDVDCVVTESMVKAIPEGATTLPLEICLVSKKVKPMNTYTYQFFMALDITFDAMKMLIDRQISVLTGILTDPSKCMAYLGMTGDEDEARVNEDGETVIAYDEDLRSKVMRALDANPSLLFDPWVQSKLKEDMKRSFLDMRLGRILVEGGFYFGASEPNIIRGKDTLLEEGQAYLNGRTGRVVVSRTPCLHRSEVFTLELVTSPELEEAYGNIKDVVLFNVKDYSLARAGGADCDGDKFFISPEQVLIDSCEDLDEVVMGDPASKPKQVMITYEEVCKHVYAKAKQSQIGHCTDLGTTWSDKYRTAQSPEEAMFFDNKVVRLRLTQGALIDSAKKDYDVKIDKDLETNERPHWLERKGQRTVIYHSSSPMGQAYDYVMALYQQFMEANTNTNMSLLMTLVEQLDPMEYSTIEKTVFDYMNNYNKEVIHVLESVGINVSAENGWDDSRDNLDQDTKDILKERMGAVAEKYQNLMDSLSSIVSAETVAICAYFMAYSKASNGRGYSFPWTTCVDGLLSAFSRVAEGRYMLTPITTRKDINAVTRVKVCDGLVFDETVGFIGVSRAHDGEYETTVIKDRLYVKALRTNTLGTLTKAGDTFQYTLVGLTPEVLGYLASCQQVAYPVNLQKYEDNGAYYYGMFYEGVKIAKLAENSFMVGAYIAGKQTLITAMMPSKTGKSATLTIKVLQ